MKKHGQSTIKYMIILINNSNNKKNIFYYSLSITQINDIYNFTYN